MDRKRDDRRRATSLRGSSRGCVKRSLKSRSWRKRPGILRFMSHVGVAVGKMSRDRDFRLVPQAPAAALALAALALPCAGAAAADRIALVVGNARYAQAPLKNPVNDARLIGETLRELGFDVQIITDADEKSMEDAVKSLGQRLGRVGSDGVGLFYYAGHGVQSREGVNYLIPIGAGIESDMDLGTDALQADWVLEIMQGYGKASVNLLVLDACRNNPYEGVRGTRGLAPMARQTGALIAYSAAPGQVAMDGEGRHSPYALALAAKMRQPGRTLPQVFQDVRGEVLRRTNSSQTPEEVSQLVADHYFVPPAAGPGPVAGSPSPGGVGADRIAADLWEQIKGTDNPERIREFMREHAGSSYVSVARARLDALAAERWRQLRASTDPEALDRFASRYPGTPPVASARERAERLRRGPLAGATFRDPLSSGGSGPEMVVIPAGSFQMGCVSGRNCADDEKPVHTVTIARPFAVSAYEVTFAEWDACVSGGGCGGSRADSYTNDQGWGRGNRPVTTVFWNGAKAYVSWLSRETGQPYRLLTESEWEYAARAGSTTQYSWGNDIGDNRANCRGCGSRWDDSSTAPVGSFAPNAFGLYDMHGNSGEWVEDCWNGSYAGAPTDGSAWLRGDCSQRVLRGGYYWTYPRGVRSANRFGFDATTGGIGFRVARNLIP